MFFSDVKIIPTGVKNFYRDGPESRSTALRIGIHFLRQTVNFQQPTIPSSAPSYVGQVDSLALHKSWVRIPVSQCKFQASIKKSHRLWTASAETGSFAKQRDSGDKYPNW